MLKHIKTLVLSVLCACIVSVVISGTMTAYAATTTNLPSGFLIGDQDGIQVGVDGLYYIDADNLQPGDVITKKLTLQNQSQNDTSSAGKIPYKLTMRAEPLFSTGPVDLLDAVHLELKLDGKTVYSGRCRGDDDVNMIENALQLGEYKIGDLRVLDIKLTVDPKMIAYEDESEAEFKWIFHAYRDSTVKPPNTGDPARIGLYVLSLVISGNLLFLVWYKRKRNKLKTQAQSDSTV